MPVPNDLTPEEEAMFGNHGVEPAGAGAEPTGESNQPVTEQPATPHGDRQPRAANGQFAPATQEQPQEQQPADPNAPTDPNAAPADPNAPPADPNAPGQPPQGFVPHAAMHAERLRANQLAQQNAQLVARTNAILMARQQQQPEPLPDLNTDPVGYVQALGERQEQFFRQQQEDQQNQQIDSAINQDEQTFRSYTPDYDQASDHYVQSRAQELLHFYSPQQAQQIMLQEARQMAQEAWQRGIPAAQMVYQMAQARGYRPGTAAPQPQAQQMSPQGFNNGQPAPVQPAQPGYAPVTTAAAPAQPGITPQQQVQAIRQGQGAARSLSTGAGSAAPAQLNAEALLAMSDEEFEQHFGLGTKGANARFANVG